MFSIINRSENVSVKQETKISDKWLSYFLKDQVKREMNGTKKMI